MSMESPPDWQSSEAIDALLGPSMSVQRLVEAVERSGYPLQTVVATEFAKRDFRVDEEWAYEDAESKKRRALDVLGEFSAGDFIVTEEGKTSVLLALLAECKQSRHPYLAFEAVSPRSPALHPAIVGLGTQSLELHPDDPALNWFQRIPLSIVLSMSTAPFVVHPPTVTTISRAVAKGKDFELSGEEPHNALMRPLIKAAQSYREHWRRSAQERSATRVGRLVLPVAVVDGPLLLVRGGPNESELTPANWLRVVSHRAVAGKRDPWEQEGHDFVDVVHVSFLDRFLDNYAIPFVNEYHHRLGGIHPFLAKGKATVEGWTGDALPEALPDLLRARIGR